MNTKTRDKLRKIFNKHDPIKIYFDKKINFDEYDPEIKQVMPLFKRSKDAKVFTKEIHALFIKMFDKSLAGSRSKYEKVAREVYHFLKVEKALTKCKVYSRNRWTA